MVLPRNQIFYFVVGTWGGASTLNRHAHTLSISTDKYITYGELYSNIVR